MYQVSLNEDTYINLSCNSQDTHYMMSTFDLVMMKIIAVVISIAIIGGLISIQAQGGIVAGASDKSTQSPKTH